MIHVISTHFFLGKIYHMGTNISKGWEGKFNPTLCWKESQNVFITVVMSVIICFLKITMANFS